MAIKQEENDSSNKLLGSALLHRVKSCVSILELQWELEQKEPICTIHVSTFAADLELHQESANQVGGVAIPESDHIQSHFM